MSGPVLSKYPAEGGMTFSNVLGAIALEEA